MDPPYQKIFLYQEVIKELIEPLKGGLIEFWIEGDRRDGLQFEDLKLYDVSITKIFNQGTKYLAILG